MSAKTADNNSLSLLASRSFMLKKALPMSRSVANRAVTHAKAIPAEAATTTALARCTAQYVQSAAKPAKFLSNPAAIVLYTAATVSEDK